ncbi:MAG: YqgE/AlgH family protein [Gammaproteobacteria bacterium]|nr:YqgE/AlgH family protein [Gammaproteobacteria bacterium]
MPEDQKFINLVDSFIFAMPELGSPLFYRSVVYICEHTAEGAMGIIINRPLDIQLNSILEKMQIPITATDVYKQPVFLGGPLQTQRGFVLHHGGVVWPDSVLIKNDLYITSSKEILQAIAKAAGPKQTLVALGFSGWGAGQLEQELLDNAWLSVPADPKIIFETPVEKRWQAAAALLKIDVAFLTGQIGHA